MSGIIPKINERRRSKLRGWGAQSLKVMFRELQEDFRILEHQIKLDMSTHYHGRSERFVMGQMARLVNDTVVLLERAAALEGGEHSNERPEAKQARASLALKYLLDGD